jgi:hypothetical protein
MPIIPDEPPAGRPLSRADFFMWWWPEFTAAATCVSAGLLLWGPLAGLAAVPLLSPAAEAVQLAGHARREAEQERLALAEPVDAEPILAVAERLDRPEIEQAGR